MNWEERTRARKTSRLLVTALRDRLTLVDLALLDRDEWTDLADRAGIRPPSDTTRREVLTNLQRREHGRWAPDGEGAA